jgi:hypothetical protein
MWLTEGEASPVLEEVNMKNKRIIIGAVGISMLLGAGGAAGNSYNPIKWFKKSPSPTASEQLAANKEEEKKLTLQLQALLPPRTSLKDACSVFKGLEECVAALHVSHNLKIKFNCLKWDLTGVQPSGDVKSCQVPARDKGMSLYKAIRVLKPDADARTEAKSAERRAREDIKDASS